MGGRAISCYWSEPVNVSKATCDHADTRRSCMWPCSCVSYLNIYRGSCLLVCCLPACCCLSAAWPRELCSFRRAWEAHVMSYALPPPIPHRPARFQWSLAGIVLSLTLHPCPTPCPRRLAVDRFDSPKLPVLTCGSVIGWCGRGGQATRGSQDLLTTVTRSVGRSRGNSIVQTLWSVIQL